MMVVRIAAMLTRSDDMLVDSKSDGNGGEPRWKRWVDVGKDGDAQDGKLRPLLSESDEASATSVVRTSTVRHQPHLSKTHFKRHDFGRQVR
jgi:hypothetical protein